MEMSCISVARKTFCRKAESVWRGTVWHKMENVRLSNKGRRISSLDCRQDPVYTEVLVSE